MITLGLLGSAIGLGKVLQSRAPWSWRVAFGQALCAGGLGVAAGSLFLVFPDMDPRALTGCACIFATLGANALERLVFKRIEKLLPEE